MPKTIEEVQRATDEMDKADARAMAEGDARDLGSQIADLTRRVEELESGTLRKK